ncbi:MAG TPA: hypothetical protein VKH42_07390 [Vicinamibacterales bacterium]|nr:hypothetical protein [Vicinamibacterales bacterium]
MDQYRVVVAGGKEYGPVDLPGLIKWVSEGRVTATTLIRKNQDEPVPANTLPELGASFAPPASSTVPPIATTVALPSEWRSWDFIGLAWELVKPHWLPLGVMFLLLSIIGAVPYIGACITLVVRGAIMVGIYRAILGLLAGRTPTIEMMFGGFDRFGQAFVAVLVISILVSLGLIFLIVPGIILALMWFCTMPVIAETDQDFWTAMQTSAALTKGYRWQLFCLALANIPILLLGILCCCVGVCVSQAVMYTSFALAYRFLQARQGGATA